MPKKFSTEENPKSVAARERKKAVQDAETAKKQQEEEDLYWQDDSKLCKKKQQKKDDQIKKREQQLAKKVETKQLLEKEMSSLKSAKVPPPKLTRAQIGAARPTDKEKIVKELEENMNRLKLDGVTARSVDEAICALSEKKEDKHPEKRRKAAFTAFENRRIKELKAENPTLKLSQLKEQVFKEWKKSPENPMNIE